MLKRTLSEEVINHPSKIRDNKDTPPQAPNDPLQVLA
jgi:hypothetical protein